MGTRHLYWILTDPSFAVCGGSSGSEGWRACPKWPSGCDFYVMDGQYRLYIPFPYRTSCTDRSCSAACWWNFQLMFYCIVTEHNHPSWATSRKEGLAWYSIYSKPLPSLWVKVVLLSFRLAGMYLSWILSFLILLFIAWLYLAPLEIWNSNNTINYMPSRDINRYRALYYTVL